MKKRHRHKQNKKASSKLTQGDGHDGAEARVPRDGGERGALGRALRVPCVHDVVACRCVCHKYGTCTRIYIYI